MKTKDFNKLVELTNVGGGWIPANANAEELLEQSVKGEIITLLEVGDRDIKFHRAYFSLLGFIYDYLPPSFKKQVRKEHFYQFCKHVAGEYEVLFTFKDGTKMVEYDSISFGSMSQKSFETYIRNQLPFIYENIIAQFFQGDMYNGIINNIEEEYKKFLSKL